MAEHRGSSPEAGGAERIPFWQIFLDDYFLLLTLGLALPFVIYIAWGLWDLAHLPPAP